MFSMKLNTCVHIILLLYRFRSGRSRRKTHESSSYTYEPSTSEHKYGLSQFTKRAIIEHAYRLEPRLPENKLANSSRTSQSTDQAAASEAITDVKAHLYLLKEIVEKASIETRIIRHSV